MFCLVVSKLLILGLQEAEEGTCRQDQKWFGSRKDYYSAVLGNNQSGPKFLPTASVVTPQVSTHPPLSSLQDALVQRPKPTLATSASGAPGTAGGFCENLSRAV